MEVSEVHPDYAIQSIDWKTIRDCIKGQRHIKSQGITYLEKSQGQAAIEKKFNCAGAGPYELYKSGARYPDWVDNTTQGFVGLATRTPWDIQGMTSGLDYLIPDAGNGIPLEDWQGLLIAEGMEVGRYAMFPDAPVEGGDYKIAWYQTESVINWKLDNGQPVLVVLKESVEAESENIFSHDTEDQYRVVRMDGESCFVDIYTERGIDTDRSNIPLAHHEGYCPVVVGGAVNNDWAIDKPPVIGICEAALAYYKLSAQQRWAIRATCDPMFLALGFRPGEIEIWGGGSVFEKEDLPGQASIEVIEVKGDGIDKATAEMQSEEAQALRMSHLLTDKATVEASSSLRQRTNSKTASLKSVDRCAAAAFEKTLNMLAQRQGAPSKITVTSSFDYTDEEIDAVALEKISQVAERGHLPEEAVVEYAQRRGMMEAYDLKQVRTMIDADDERRAEKAAAFFPPVADDDEVDPVAA